MRGGMTRRGLLGAASIGGAAWATHATGADTSAPPPRLPIDAFAEKPPMEELQLSPDGSRVLARMQVHGHEMLGIYELATGKFVTFSLPDGGDLATFRWAGDGRVLVSIIGNIDVITGEGIGRMHVTGRGSRLACYDVATQKAIFIGMQEEAAEGDDIIHLDPAGEYLLLSIRRSLFEGPYVYRFDLKDNKASLVMRPQYEVLDWYADETGVVRAGLGITDKNWFVLYRSAADVPFRKIERNSAGLFERTPVAEMNFVAGSDKGYILSNKNSGRYGIFEFDFAKEALGPCVFSSPTNDVDGAEFDASGHKLEAIRYTDEQPRIHWVDPMFDDLQAGFDRASPGRINAIVSRSRDNDVLLLHSSTPKDRGFYYVFHASTSKLSRLVSVSGRLDPARMSEMKPVTYKARDGLTIPAYLTLPAGRPAKNLPLVIMPHGGPYGVRDMLGFDVEVQFLANRGYAVLQPNYRGSDGYGLAYSKRGEGEWGRRMQDDLDDGMDWLVGERIVDARRCCLVGGSYGGYAAAWGATRNPERYRCAACFAGVFDLRTQLRYAGDFLSSAHYREFKSTVRGPAEFDLESVSPFRQIDRLKVPLLLVHGDDDRTVPVAQTRSYAAALKHAGKPFELAIIPKEGHGFREPGSLALWLGKVEALLDAHNPAGA